MKYFVIHGNVASKKNNKEIRTVKKYINGKLVYKPMLTCSDRYKKWHQYAVEELLLQKHEFSTSRAKIVLTFYWGDNLRRDTDNGVSSIFDTLVDAGILTDDNWKVVYKHLVLCDYDKSNPRCEIRIYDPEEKFIYEF